jgi:hypothetical protein
MGQSRPSNSGSGRRFVRYAPDRDQKQRGPGRRNVPHGSEPGRSGMSPPPRLKFMDAAPSGRWRGVRQRWRGAVPSPLLLGGVRLLIQRGKLPVSRFRFRKRDVLAEIDGVEQFSNE